MHELDAAEAALEEVTPHVVARYRDAGILTWRLLYEIEAVIVEEVLATGEFDAVTLNVFRAADVMGYPRDERPVCFAKDCVVPCIFNDIEKAWSNLH